MVTYQKILLISSVIIFTSYLFYIWFRFGIQKDISSSYRKLKHNWIFTLVLWFTMIPVMIVGEHGLLFFAGAGICIVGTAPRYWEKLEGRVHRIAAIGGILLALIWMLLKGFIWFAVPFILFAFLIEITFKKKRLIELKNHTWWVEVAAYYMLLITLLLKTNFIKI
jgi:hypothetical protein